jgi:hypothetical protein
MRWLTHGGHVGDQLGFESLGAAFICFHCDRVGVYEGIINSFIFERPCPFWQDFDCMKACSGLWQPLYRSTSQAMFDVLICSAVWPLGSAKFLRFAPFRKPWTLRLSLPQAVMVWFSSDLTLFHMYQAHLILGTLG